MFPVIRRRFRNEQERRSGLEQIKGALLLGMTEIARQTVDFLYEDNGGRPKDLMLPTLDDIKEDLAKFTVGKFVMRLIFYFNSFHTSILTHRLISE